MNPTRRHRHAADAALQTHADVLCWFDDGGDRSANQEGPLAGIFVAVLCVLSLTFALGLGQGLLDWIEGRFQTLLGDSGPRQVANDVARQACDRSRRDVPCCIAVPRRRLLVARLVDPGKVLAGGVDAFFRYVVPSGGKNVAICQRYGWATAENANLAQVMRGIDLQRLGGTIHRQANQILRQRSFVSRVRRWSPCFSHQHRELAQD